MRGWLITKRTKILIYIFTLLFTMIFCRIVYFQLYSSKKLSLMANSQYSYKEDLCDNNFMIFDSKGRQTIQYKNKYYAVISPDVFLKNNFNLNSDSILTLMYTLRNYNSDYDISKIGTLNNGQKMYYSVDEATYNKLKKISDVKGFYCYTFSLADTEGVWKVENMLMSAKRVSDNSFKDKDSLEMKIYEKTKDNKKPQIIFNRDISGNILDEKVKISEENVNLRLTLDKEIQEKMKEILQKNNKHKQIGAILMEGSTGKILGMVQKDDKFSNVNIGISTSNGFFPGSIFKVIVEEAGLEKGIVKAGDKFTCRGLYEDKRKNHGTLSVEEAFVVSCNDIFAQIGIKVGYNNFYEIARAQGLYNKVLMLDGEVEGKSELLEPKLADGTLSLASIGQLNRITPIEAISIANTVVNNGVYVKPYILDAYVDNKNNEIEKLTTESKSIINKSTADTLKRQMIEVVQKGTGQGAFLKDTEIGGKTGTNQKVELSKTTNKKEESSDGWFIGFFKCNNKYYSMVVFVQDIDKNSESGGLVAAPIFKDIVTSVKESLNSK